MLRIFWAWARGWRRVHSRLIDVAFRPSIVREHIPAVCVSAGPRSWGSCHGPTRHGGDRFFCMMMCGAPLPVPVPRKRCGWFSRLTSRVREVLLRFRALAFLPLPFAARPAPPSTVASLYLLRAAVPVASRLRYRLARGGSSTPQGAVARRGPWAPRLPRARRDDQ